VSIRLNPTPNRPDKKSQGFLVKEIMNKDQNNPTEQWNDVPSLASLVKPLCIDLTETTEGWKVEISSLSPGDAMMALSREDLLEDSTILCGTGVTDWVACVNGPIEIGDANAILKQVSNSTTPLTADFRMQSVITSMNGGGVSAHLRDFNEVLLLVANALSAYTSSILGKPVSLPDLGLIDALLYRSPFLSMKPIETEVFSSFLDIGISTSRQSEPANLSVVYDIHSDSWHGD